MDEIRSRIESLRRDLDGLRPIGATALRRLRHYFDVDLTHTSNAIEGNTLTAVETELVIDKGVTIGGKPLRDHLEALDHHEALGFIRDLARRGAKLSQSDLRAIHALVVRRSQPEGAGRYADQGRFIRTNTGRHVFPTPVEVPALMEAFIGWLTAAPADIDRAIEAHRRFVAIHPFNDGNGRTARLLMNLLLIGAGYPPVAVRPADRLRYIEALADDQAGHGSDAYQGLMLERLEAMLIEYLSLFREAAEQAQDPRHRTPSIPKDALTARDIESPFRRWNEG